MMTKLGATMTTLAADMTGKKKTTITQGKVAAANVGTSISSNTFLLTIIILGGVLFLMAFGGKE